MQHLAQSRSAGQETWRRPFVAAALALVLCTVGFACWAQQGAAAPNDNATVPEHGTPEGGGAASFERDDSWRQLTKPQQLVLDPLKAVWPSMGDARHRKWKLIADRIGAFPPDAQQRLRSRMLGWAQLTADQRAEARMEYLQARSGQARGGGGNKRAADSVAATGLRPVSPGLLQVAPGATTILVRPPTRRSARH